MPPALIWSIESVVLGLWALALAPYSTPLHVFIARCHVLISAFTALLHMIVIARNLVVGSAISQAFLCAVSALFLMYISAVLDKDQALYFRLPSVGLLKLDALVGCVWFTIAMLSGLGMVLSFVKNEAVTGRNAVDGASVRATTQFMFHSYGVHLVVILPCITLTHVQWWMRWIFIALWLAHVVYRIASFFGVRKPDHSTNPETDVGWFRITEYGVLFSVYLIFRFAALWVALVVLIFVDMGFSQRVLVFCVLGVAIATSVEVLELLVFRLFPDLPAIDGYFAARTETADSNSSAAVGDVVNNDGPIAGPGVASRAWFPIQPSYLPRHVDPAAVLMQRAKMV